MLLTVLIVIFVLAALLVGGLQLLFKRDRKALEKAYKDNPLPRMPGFGTTRSLTILPLIDWYTASDDLKGEAGVSYLIKTDAATILLDTGYNAKNEDPSPLEHNMKALGIELDDIDAVVISHLHLDHVGGLHWVKKNTFSVGARQPDLTGKRVFVPAAMNYPELAPTVCAKPTVIAPGVATAGGIDRRLAIGTVREQAVAVNVEGKGIVLIVGCGHQGIPKLLESAERVFDTPVHGFVGGLHYPVPHGRSRMFGFLDIQRLVSGDEGLFDPVSEKDVRENIELLLSRKPGVVALSAHDSSDEAIEMFHDAFGPAHCYIRVGEPITVTSPS